MGGLNPPIRSLLPRLVFLQQELQVQQGPLAAFGSKPKGQPFLGGVSGAVPPQDGPPDLGIARDLLGSIPIRLLPSFTDFSDFLVQIILVIGRVCIHS